MADLTTLNPKYVSAATRVADLDGSLGEKIIPFLRSQSELPAVVASVNDINMENISHIASVTLEVLGAIVESSESSSEIIPFTYLRNLTKLLDQILANGDALITTIDNSINQDGIEIATISSFNVTSTDGQTFDLSEVFTNFANSIEGLRNSIVVLRPFVGGKSSLNLSKAIRAHLDAKKEYQQTLISLKKTEERSSSILQTLEQKSQELDSISNMASQHATETQTARSDAENARTIAQQARDQIQQIISDAEAFQERVQDESMRLETFEKSVDRREQSITVSEEKIREITANVNLQNEQLNSLIEKSEKLLSHATSAALGASFSNEAGNRLIAMRVSAFALLLSLAGMFATIYWIISEIGEASLLSIDDLPRTLLKLSALVPTAILAKVSAKNLAVNRLMREDYSHKASLSIALEGYRSLVPENSQTDMIMETMSAIIPLKQVPAIPTLQVWRTGYEVHSQTVPSGISQ